MRETFKIGFFIISLLIATVTTCRECVGDDGLKPVNSKGFIEFYPDMSPYVIYRQTRDECGEMSGIVETVSIYQESYKHRHKFFYTKNTKDCKGEKPPERIKIPQRSLYGCTIGISHHVKNTFHELAKMKMNPSADDSPKKYHYTLATNNGYAFMKFETNDKGKGFDYLKHRIQKKCGN